MTHDEAVHVGPVEDLVVARGHEVDVSHMDGIEAGVSEPGDDTRCEVGVEEELHAGRETGTSRSFTAAAAYSSAASTSSSSRYG